MTYEEAYKILTEHTRNYVGLKDAEALEVAIGVLGKMIENVEVGDFCENRVD